MDIDVMSPTIFDTAPRNPNNMADTRLELAKRRRGGALASGLGALPEHLRRLVAAESTAPLAALLVVLIGAEVTMSNRDVKQPVSQLTSLPSPRRRAC